VCEDNQRFCPTHEEIREVLAIECFIYLFCFMLQRIRDEASFDSQFSANVYVYCVGMGGH
jgi:hypothetical protein